MSKHSWHDWSTLNKQRNIADPKKCDLMNWGWISLGKTHLGDFVQDEYNTETCWEMPNVVENCHYRKWSRNLLEELRHHHHRHCHHHRNHSHDCADQNRNLFNQLRHPKFLLLLSEMNVIIATSHNYWNEFQSAQNSTFATKALNIYYDQNQFSDYIAKIGSPLLIYSFWEWALAPMDILGLSSIWLYSQIFVGYLALAIKTLNFWIYSQDILAFRMFWTFMGERKNMWKTKCGVNEFQWSAQNAVSATKALWSKLFFLQLSHDPTFFSLCLVFDILLLMISMKANWQWAWQWPKYCNLCNWRWWCW